MRHALRPAGPSLASLASGQRHEAAAEASSLEPEASSLFRLEELPADALARVMQYLSVRDIHAALLASKGLNEALQDERVWYGLCTTCWGTDTDPHRWLVAPLPRGPPCTPSRATLPAPQTYRRLYMLLHESAPIVGLWRLQGEGPRSSLIHFRWGRDGIEGVEVEPRAPLSGRADASPWARICPARGLTTAVRVEPEGGHATVTVYGAQGQRIHRSPSAEAVAAVALPHSQATPSPLGTSPKGSFEHEWLQFMAGNVQNSRTRQRRRSQRGLGQARPEGPAIYHLKRVPELRPSGKHPYCDCWAADYGPQGLEILQLRYDFKGKAAQLRADKVVGDDLVPAGQCSWWAAAAPIPLPWPAEEQEVVQQQEERWLQQREWWDGAEEEEDEEEGDGADEAYVGEEAGGVAGEAAAADGSAAKAPPRVVAIHRGEGQVAGPGFASPEWVAGRLLAFADGSLSFVWGEGLDMVTEMRRLRLPQ
ncbi:hypothetical protein ABPG75_013033 [Micractinium tetrahymenae]